MVDEENIDQLAAEAIQAMRRYIAAEIAKLLGTYVYGPHTEDK